MSGPAIAKKLLLKPFILIVLLSYTTANLHDTVAQCAHNLYHAFEHLLHHPHSHHASGHEFMHVHTHGEAHHHTHNGFVDKLLATANEPRDDDTTDRRALISELKLLDHLTGNMISSVSWYLTVQMTSLISRSAFRGWDLEPPKPPPKHLTRAR